jgi:hypothetical protein
MMSFLIYAGSNSTSTPIDEMRARLEKALRLIRATVL